MTQMQSGFIIGLAIASAIYLPLLLVNRKRDKMMRKSNAILGCENDYQHSYIMCLQASMSPDDLKAAQNSTRMVMLNVTYHENINRIHKTGKY